MRKRKFLQLSVEADNCNGFRYDVRFSILSCMTFTCTLICGEVKLERTIILMRHILYFAFTVNHYFIFVRLLLDCSLISTQFCRCLGHIYLETFSVLFKIDSKCFLLAQCLQHSQSKINGVKLSLSRHFSPWALIISNFRYRRVEITNCSGIFLYFKSLRSYFMLD